MATLPGRLSQRRHSYPDRERFRIGFAVRTHKPEVEFLPGEDTIDGDPHQSLRRGVGRWRDFLEDPPILIE